jgi:WD40 repeat protein
MASYLAVGASAGAILVYRAGPEKYDHMGTVQYKDTSQRSLVAYAFTVDGRTLLSFVDNNIIIWDISSMMDAPEADWPLVIDNVYNLIQAPGMLIHSVSVPSQVTADSRALVHISSPGYFVMYDLSSREEVWRVTSPPFCLEPMFFGQDAEFVIACGVDEDYEPTLWIAGSVTGSVASKLGFGEILDLRNGIEDLAVHPFEPLIALAVSTYAIIATLRWPDLNSVSLHQQLRGHTGLVSCVRFSGCGTKLVSASEDSTLRIWNTLTWENVVTIPSGLAILKLAVSGDSPHVICTSSEDEMVRIFDGVSGQFISEIVSNRSFCCSSPRTVVLL